jgi:hypothetical protein
MDEPTPNQIENGLRRFLAEHVDLEQRLPALIREALERQTDDRAAGMLRRGASLLVKPHDDGTASLIAAYTADSEMLTAMRAAA